jgi:hypothetical protein
MERKIRVEDININAEFLIDDLKKSILVDNTFNKNIVKCWQEDIRFLIHNGMCGDNENIFDLTNKDDLKECLDLGMDAEDIAYLVNMYRDNEDNTQFFTYTNTQQMYGLHILTKKDVMESILSQIENIAYNILKYPYNPLYGELYREFVTPMIDRQL